MSNMRERRLCHKGTAVLWYIAGSFDVQHERKAFIAVLWLYIAGSFDAQHERKAFMPYRYSCIMVVHCWVILAF